MGKSTINEMWSGERSAELVSTRETRNPKPTLKTWLPHRTDRNPKDETRNPKPTAKLGFELRNPKPEPRNPKPTLKTWLPEDRPKPETRNPKPTTKIGFKWRNPKPKTRNRLSNPENPNDAIYWGKPVMTEKTCHLTIWRFDALIGHFSAQCSMRPFFHFVDPDSNVGE